MTRYIATYLVPTWAIPYLVNYDWSGLTGEDVEEVDEWEYREFVSCGWTCLEYCVQWEDGVDFEVQPAFGLPTDCVQVIIYGIQQAELDEEEQRVAVS